MATEPEPHTYLALLPEDVITRELAPLLEHCERPPPNPPVLKPWAKWGLYALALVACILIELLVIYTWPHTVGNAERLCVPYICDWVTVEPWNNSCGWCDNNTAACYWSVMVNGYTDQLVWGSDGWSWICPGQVGPPSMHWYYSTVPPALNGTSCYKPSEACTGEDWVGKWTVDENYQGWCTPLLDCTPRLAGYTYGFGRMVFIIAFSIVIGVVFLFSLVCIV